MLAPGHTVQESDPIGNSRLFQFVTLLQDIGRSVPLVDALQRPVIAALHAQGDLVQADVPQSLQLFYRLVLEVGDARRGVHVLQLRQVFFDKLEPGHKILEGHDQWIGTQELDSPGLRHLGRDFGGIGLDVFQRLHPERNTLVHGAELTPVMRTALGNLDQRPGGPEGLR